MLAKPNILLARRLCVGLENHVVTPVADSPLEAVVSASMPVAANPVGEPEDIILQASMHEDAGGIVQHDMVAEEIQEVTAQALRAHFSFARNIVKTAINQTVDAVETAINNAEMPNYSIVSLRPAEILSSPLLEDIIGRYNEQGAERVALPSGFPEMSEVRLLEMLKTGVPEFDNGISDLVAGHKAGWLSGLWNLFFQAGGHWEPTYDLPSADAYLVTNLWCNHLVDNVPEGVRTSLDTYKVMLSNLMAQTGRTVIAIIEAYDRYEESGVVVLTYPPVLPFLKNVADGEIKVYGPSYEKFLLAGGTPEIIFGAACGTRDLLSSALIANADQNKIRYESHITTSANTHDQQLNANLLTAIGVEVSRYVQECPKEQLNPEYTDPVGQTQEAVKQQVLSLQHSDVRNNLYGTVSQVICRGVYSHTNAEQILSGINARQAVNPNESLMDSAYHVAIGLMTDYWLSQADIVKM